MEPNMNIKSTVRTGILTFAFCCGLFLTVPGASGLQKPDKQPVDKQQLLKDARSAYYSLKTEGMQSFRCEITPNWAALLEDQRKSNPEGIGKAIERLSALKFTVEVDSEGSAKVQHTEIAADNDEMAKGLSQIYSGMEQMTVGFFQTWSVFVVHPALPEAGTEFELESGPELHHIAYNEGGSKIGVTMTRRLAITAVKVTADKFVSTIKPQFASTPKGYLLIGYDADYQGATGDDRTVLQVNIENQKVSSLQIPQKLALKGSYNGSPFAVEVTFSGCTATLR
jgi:hypothetical protein